MNKNIVCNNLVVIKENGRDKHGRILLLCKCLLCGNTKSIKKTNINTGKATSCGCDTHIKISKSHRKHKGRTEYKSEYSSWKAMRNRVNNPNYHAYHRYGGRGIEVCERWNDFNNFVSDMGKKPFKNSQIDRIDNNGNYEPSNCKWSSPKENSNNRKKKLNSTGYTGVQKINNNSFLCYIYINRKQKYIGTFKTLQEAVENRSKYIINYNNKYDTSLKYENFRE